MQLVEGMQVLRQGLIDALTTDRAALARAWIIALDPRDTALVDARVAQADDFLRRLAEGLSAAGTEPLPHVQDALLQRDYPFIYRVSGMLALAGVLAERLARRGMADVPLAALSYVIQAGLAAGFHPEPTGGPFTEMLGRLSLFSVELTSLRDPAAIIARTLEEAPRLVGAERCAVWTWDADQRAPLMIETLEGNDMAGVLPGPLLEIFRETCESHCAFHIDAGESEGETDWPELLRDRTVAFVPLPAESACLGVLTIRGHAGQVFTHDDILGLSALGNLVSTALQHARLHEHELRLINLLQSSITQLVQATFGSQVQRDAFLHSLLQFAVGLTRANVVGASLTLDDTAEVLRGATGRHLALEPAQQLIDTLAQRVETHPLPAAGLVSELADIDMPDDALARQHYTLAPITLGERQAGLLCAFSPVALSEEQVVFLHTMAGLVGVGIANLRQVRSNETLLLQLTNLIDFITNISARELAAPQDGVVQQIMAQTAQRLSRAANMPICVCGWIDEESAIRVWPGSIVGLPEALAEQLLTQALDVDGQLPLTVNNRVIRAVLQDGKPVTLRHHEAPGRPTFRWLLAQGVQDWICVPMVVQSHTRGVVILADTRPHALTVREEALIATYANQAALMLEHALLNAERRRKQDQAERLYTYVSALSTSLAVNDILDRLMEAARGILGVPATLVTLSVEDSTQQVGRAAQGLRIPSDGGLVFADQGLVGTVARRRRPLGSLDLRRDGRATVLRELAEEAGLASSLTVPIMAHAHSALLGTLTIISDAPRDFSEDEQELLQALTTQAALAMQNAQTLALETQRTQELHRLLGHLALHLPALLETALRVLEATARDGAADGLTHAQRRLESLLAVQREIGDDALDAINVKAALTRLFHERAVRGAAGQAEVRVTGAAVRLPWEAAMALTLLAHELALTAESAAPAGGLRATLTLQQGGGKIHVQLDDNGDYGGQPAPLAPAILELVTQTLRGAITEGQGSGGHFLRYGFRPDRPS